MLLSALCLTQVACVSRGFPNHGGGKRFYREQQVLTRSVQTALDRIPFEEIGVAADGKPVQVYVLCVGDQGGGSGQASNGSSLLNTISFGLLGDDGPVPGIGRGAIPTAPIVTPRDTYTPFSFANALDLEYLRGELMVRLAAANVRIASGGNIGSEGAGPETSSLYLYVLVTQFGIDKSDLNLLVYSEEKLEARTALRVVLVDNHAESGATASPPLQASATFNYMENFVLGFGPVNGGLIEEGDDK